ncbi:hypothetical protein QBC44DRAFT_373191 [Cladorrhinum sp. PSN332]|nr:hypothetical protein QBC44DRAFT_373191 [Cladorrhinum sp. PSN332]
MSSQTTPALRQASGPDFLWDIEIYNSQNIALQDPGLKNNDFEEAVEDAEEPGHQSLHTWDDRMMSFHRLHDNVFANLCVPINGLIATATLDILLVYFQNGPWNGHLARQMWDSVLCSTFYLSKAFRFPNSFSSPFKKRPESMIKYLQALSCEEHHHRAAKCVAEISWRTKPAWVLPGRSMAGIEDIVIHELGRRPDPPWEDYLQLRGHGARYSFKKNHAVIVAHDAPYKDDFHLEDYLGWRIARQHAETDRTNKMSTDYTYRNFGREEVQSQKEKDGRQERVANLLARDRGAKTPTRLHICDLKGLHSAPRDYILHF